MNRIAQLSGLVAMLVLASATWAGGISCSAVGDTVAGERDHLVLAYGIVATTSDTARTLRTLRQTVLQQYMDSVGLKSDTLVPVRCDQMLDIAGLTTSDVQYMDNSRVAVAIWRSSDGKKAFASHAAIPRLIKATPPMYPDLEVSSIDASDGPNTADGWVAFAIKDKLALQGMLGLGLGMRLLDLDPPVAKLLLCKSRNDFKLASDLIVQPPLTSLLADISQLIDKADRQISVGRLGDDLKQRIRAACSLG